MFVAFRNRRYFGVSGCCHLLWEQGLAGSNPAAPINGNPCQRGLSRLPALLARLPGMAAQGVCAFIDLPSAAVLRAWGCSALQTQRPGLRRTPAGALTHLHRPRRPYVRPVTGADGTLEGDIGEARGAAADAAAMAKSSKVVVRISLSILCAS